MWTSDRHEGTDLRRSTRTVARFVTRLAVFVLMVGAASAAAEAQGTPSISRISGTLSWGTVLPGQTPVVIAPWYSGGAITRKAPVFQITGAPSQVVFVKPIALPEVFDNGAGGQVEVLAYTMSYNTIMSSAGAVALTCQVGDEVAVTLDSNGYGYLSIGATLLTTATQGKGSYMLPDGGVIQVR